MLAIEDVDLFEQNFVLFECSLFGLIARKPKLGSPDKIDCQYAPVGDILGICIRCDRGALGRNFEAPCFSGECLN